MSKKKNTLKDLDEFLKQQAATLVAPAQLGDTIREPQSEPPKLSSENVPAVGINPTKILDDLAVLAKKEGSSFRRVFYDLIIKSIETQTESSPEDKILINTALYLKGGDQWKETIRSYWKDKRS
ncbi:MAG: hypothetical protein H7Y31_15925 [Chitinophagaceae bacterium]|nr:hypothetical protein [Chitinophagaceae bacterium]